MADFPAQRTLRIGTRASQLARWQAEHVAVLLRRRYPHLRVEVELFTTRGDRRPDAPLLQIGGKGVFTDEIERALREGAIDLAVHSLKDLPTAFADGLRIGAIPGRGDPRDALVLSDLTRARREADAPAKTFRRGDDAALSLASLPHGAVVGTSSLRRTAQLRRLRPDLRVVSIRGNVDTRIEKVQRGEYDAAVLACAGLDRLGIAGVIAQRVSVEEMMPAPGQGALAVQCRDESAIHDLLLPLNDCETSLCVGAEREFLAALGGGCSLPVGALATVWAGSLVLRGRVIAADGSEQIDVDATGPADAHAATDIARRAAETAMSRGAAELLKPEAIE